MARTRPRKKPPILMVVFSHYPEDPRVRREAEALIEAGCPVDVICLKDIGEQDRELVNGVEVHRLSIKRHRAGKLRCFWEYASFFLFAFCKVTALHFRRRYGIVHVHNMPDVLVFTALVARLNSTRVVLDLHDPMPEVYMTKYSVRRSHPFISLLFIVEKYSIKFAHLVLTPNLAFRDVFCSRSCSKSKVRIVMNSPQEKIFCRNDSVDTSNCLKRHLHEFSIMYHGSMHERHGLDTALLAISKLRRRIPELSFHVYGKGEFVETFLDHIKALNLEDIVHYHGFIPQEIIAEKIKSIDIGLIPNKRSPFTEINLPTRIFEYLSMGKSVVAPRTKGILDYFEENALHFFEAGNVDSLSQTILDVYCNPSWQESVVRIGISVYQMHRWETQKQDFVETLMCLSEKKSENFSRRGVKRELPESAQPRLS